MKRPRLVAARVKRCVLVIGRSKVSQRQEFRPAPARNAAPECGSGRETSMKRQAMTEWRGDLKTERGVLDKTRNSFTTRFGASYIGHEFFEMYLARTP